jgi:hypothetical protein
MNGLTLHHFDASSAQLWLKSYKSIQCTRGDYFLRPTAAAAAIVGAAKRWCKFSGGDGRTPCRRGDGLSPNHHFKLCVEDKNIKIFEDLSNSKNMVFDVKNLLNDDVDLTAKGRKEAFPAE